MGRGRRSLDRFRDFSEGAKRIHCFALCHDSKQGGDERGDRDFVAMPTPHAEILARCHGLRKILRCESLARDASWEEGR